MARSRALKPTGASRVHVAVLIEEARHSIGCGESTCSPPKHYSQPRRLARSMTSKLFDRKNPNRKIRNRLKQVLTRRRSKTNKAHNSLYPSISTPMGVDWDR